MRVLTIVAVPVTMRHVDVSHDDWTIEYFLMCSRDSIDGRKVIDWHMSPGLLLVSVSLIIATRHCRTTDYPNHEACSRGQRL